MSVPLAFPTQVDPEHILGRGFDINLSVTDLTIVEEDASTPPPIVLRSFWGKATLSTRDHWPYDFQPTVFTGTQLWDHRNLSVPPSVVAAFPDDAFGRGVGAFVSLDEFEGPYDSMEFIFRRRDSGEWAPFDETYMAWVIVDTRPTGLDPYVVVATRVLEPLIGELRRAIAQTTTGTHQALRDLEERVDDLSNSIRMLQAEPSKLRTTTKTLLGAIGAIVLNIVANQLDPLVNQIDWAILHNMILEATRQLALR